MNSSATTVKEWLDSASDQLDKAGIQTSRLDSLILLEDCLGLDRAQVLAEPSRQITTAQVAKLKKLLNRRAKHEPLAYIRGFTEFYGRNYVITPAVLTPRPESEAIIDILGDLSASGDLSRAVAKNSTQANSVVKIADVGAGSGALGITAKLEFPDSQNISVDLLEIDPKAAKIAKINVDKYTTAITVILSDLLASSTNDYHVLLCNLPYVPDGYPINRSAGFEPSIALYGGQDGLEIYRRLFDQLSKLQKRPLYLLIEALPSQHHEIERLISKLDYSLYKTIDFAQAYELNAK